MVVMIIRSIELFVTSLQDLSIGFGIGVIINYNSSSGGSGGSSGSSGGSSSSGDCCW